MRKHFTDDECAEIAMEWIRGLSGADEKLTPMADLVRRHLNTTPEKYPAARFVIRDAIRRAFQRDLIEVSKKTDKIFVPPETDLKLRLALMSRYRSLQDAVVIETPPSSDDIAVHHSLGLAMADFILDKAIFQKNNAVGLGSGRGVQMTIRALLRPSNPDRLRAENVKIMSLTGSVYSSPKRMTKSMWFDSDAHAWQLTEAFDVLDPANEPTPFLISHPLAYWNAKELNNARRRVWLGADKSAPALTHMLVGIGTFTSDPMHRFYAEAVASERDQEPFLCPIHEELVRLKNECETAIAGLRNYPDYTPVAEMSNVFLFVPPPRGISIPNQDVLTDHIDKINSRLLTVKAPQIRETQMLVVAGPKRKAHALRALLEAPKEYPVKYLCTTVDAVKEIISGRA